MSVHAALVSPPNWTLCAGFPECSPLFSMVDLMMRALSAEAFTSEAQRSRLAQLAEAIRGASAPEELSRLEPAIAEWLTGWSDGVQARLRENGGAGSKAAVSGKDPSKAGMIDPCTGLQNRSAAQQAIADAYAAGRGFLAAAFVLDRLSFINSWYGYSVGDEVLLRQSRLLAVQLGSDALYRWIGPSFVVLLDRRGGRLAHSSDISRAATATEMTLNIGSRTVLVRVSIRTSVIDSADFDYADDVLTALEAAVVEPNTRVS
jgi:diguanylate cyclase (GGDEF)-like protein